MAPYRLHLSVRRICDYLYYFCMFDWGNVILRVSCLACSQLCVVEGDKVKVEKFSSVSLDGAMVLWELKVLHVHNRQRDITQCILFIMFCQKWHRYCHHDLTRSRSDKTYLLISRPEKLFTFHFLFLEYFYITHVNKETRTSFILRKEHF